MEESPPGDAGDWADNGMRGIWIKGAEEKSPGVYVPLAYT